MTGLRIIERTLYPPIVQYLNSIGFDSVGEARVGSGASDVVFALNDQKFVIETKLDKLTSKLSTKALAQAFRYAHKLNTSDVLVLVYPENLKQKKILSSKWLYDVALKENVKAFIFTEYWNDEIIATPANIFNELKTRILTKKRKISLQSIVNEIQIIVSDLSSINAYIKKDEIVSEMTERLELFTSLGDLKDKELAKQQITHLSSYLLFNQILFYRIFRKKNPKYRLPRLEPINHVKEINNYFDEIKKIDYKAIYSVDILQHITENPKVIEILNDVIESIKLLKADLITHDLAGRFFHQLIPFEIRKILAAFYTHPNSADLLSSLTITNWNDKVIDPACGSGTLLVSSYQRKLELSEKTHKDRKISELHKQFLEKDITGCDIMPFASHLTTINLASQYIEHKTNVVRIASLDSLDLAYKISTSAFRKGKGIEITGFEKTTQLTLTNDVAWQKSGGAVSSDGRGKSFHLVPNDVVIMNPPFSDKEKMPKEMRNKINDNKILNKICGQQVNLWGNFLVLADKLLKNNGRLGLVVPINIARGKATQQIRDYILENYTPIFIIKPIEDEAFSENSAFKDILFIAEKKKPTSDDYTAIVSIKSSIKNLERKIISDLADELKNSRYSLKPKDGPMFEISFIKTLELQKHSQNLMPIIGFKSRSNHEVIDSFLTQIRKIAKNKLEKINGDIVREGFHASPSGLSELVFVTNPISESRVGRAFLVLQNELKDSIQATIKNTDFIFEISKSKLQPALRTLTSISRFNVEKIDYVIAQEPKMFDKILRLSKWKGSFDWFKHSNNVKKNASYVVVGRRFRPNSKNTHHFAFFSKNKVLAPDTFKILDFGNKDDAMYQTLILNSSITLANIVLFREQTTGGFTDIRETELVSFDIFNLKNLNIKQKEKLKKLFMRLSDEKFPSIMEQYVTNHKNRRDLDVTILEILGLDSSKINKFLDKLYPAIFEELKSKE